jgi:hypothetical protein
MTNLKISKKIEGKYMRENTLLLGIQMYNHYEKNQ